jgi:ribulose-5-phosphate 4-epimerase/fuculose-1-phosphate aldolase
MRDNRQETIQARIDLAAAFRLAAQLGMHEGICNHFSVMLGEDRFLLNPKGTHFERLTASRLIVIDEGGNTVEGEGRPPTTGFTIHTRMHLRHPAAKVVMHLHSPWSTALTAIKGGRLEMVHQNSARFFGQVAYDDEFNGIAARPDEGERMADAMGGRRVLFLANHGVIVVGETVAQTFDDFYYLERACQVQVLAMQTGRPLNVMPDELARMTAEQWRQFTINAELHFAELKQMLDETDASYAS